MKNCNIGDCSQYNLGSELYKVIESNDDGTFVVEYYLVSDDSIRKKIFYDVNPICLYTNGPITPEQFDKVAKAYQMAIDAATEIMNSCEGKERKNDNSAEDRIKADSKDIEEWNHCLNESPALESLRETFDLVLLDSESIDDHQRKLSSEQSSAAKNDEIQPNDKPFNIFEFDPPF